MNDSELISEIARIWVYHGGDADGFIMTRGKILERIQDIERSERYGDE